MNGGRLVWRRRHSVLAAAALFAVGNLAFFLTYRSGWQTRREALEARRDELRHSAQAREAEAERLVTQRNRLTGVSSAIDEFYGHRIGSERETQAAIVADLHAVLKDVGVTVPSITYGTGVVPKLPLTQMRITFAVRCDYARFKRLLRAFESDRHWIAVRSIAITQDGDQPGAVTVQLDLATYFAEPEGERETDEASAAAAARRAG